MDKSTRMFNTRAFVVLLIAISGLDLPVTGIEMHLHGFQQLTMARHVWMSAHNCLGLVFVLFSIWHLVLNRRALWKCLRGANARIAACSIEAIVACTVVAFLLLCTHAFHAGG